jgi:hypothetical protein
VLAGEKKGPVSTVGRERRAVAVPMWVMWRGVAKVAFFKQLEGDLMFMEFVLDHGSLTRQHVPLDRI